MNDGVTGIVFSLVYVSLKEFGEVGSDTYTWGITDFHKGEVDSNIISRELLMPHLMKG